MTEPLTLNFVLGIQIKLHPAVLLMLSPLGRSLSLQVQFFPIELNELILENGSAGLVVWLE